MNLFGSITPDPVGVILKTGYHRFMRKDGVGGLFKASDNRLDILALSSEFPKRGYVKKFILEAKKKFKIIYGWHFTNEPLRQAFERWGFKACYEPESFEGKIEWNDGMVWEKIE